MQRELVVASAHLVHRVRLACVQDPEGAVSPALMPGVLLGAALLSPQFMDAQFLQEAERLLAEDRVMQELPPASVAALMSAFTIVSAYHLLPCQLPVTKWRCSCFCAVCSCPQSFTSKL